MAFKSTQTYKYCPQCGGPLARRSLKPGDPERLVCGQCHYVLYADPQVAVIAVVPKDGGVVMTRRAVNPGYGLWVLPGGFMDVGERLEEALRREVAEEANLKVRVDRLLGVYSYKDSSTVVVAYLTEYLEGQMAPGVEVLDIGVFPDGEIPWDKIPFRATKSALEEYFKLKESGVTSRRNSSEADSPGR
ncbi:MAG: NUDIX hydrolase [Desulfobaccales bacterium]